MNEYVSQDEIDQRLGLTSEKQALEDLRDANIQVTEPEVGPDPSDVNGDGLGGKATPITVKVKEVLAHPDGDHEAGSAEHEKTVAEEDIKQAKVTDLERRLEKAEQERDAAIAKVKTLEDSRKQETETAKAQAKELHAELEAAKKEAKAAKVELEWTKVKLQEVRNRLEEAVKLYACPECGNLGWGSQIKELPESKFKEKIGECSNFYFDYFGLFPERVVRFRECPNPKCKHIAVVSA